MKETIMRLKATDLKKFNKSFRVSDKQYFKGRIHAFNEILTLLEKEKPYEGIGKAIERFTDALKNLKHKDQNSSS